MSNLQPSTTETITATGYVANKKKLYDIYWRLSRAYKRETIAKIISENRDITIEKAKSIKIITPLEYETFVKKVGIIH